MVENLYLKYFSRGIIMKIGIVTVEKSANVGSYLQACALKETLEALGHKIFFINTGQDKCFKREYYWWIPKRGNLKYPLRFIARNLDGIKKYKIFKENIKKFPVYDLQKDRLDLVILGSDEIWNIKRPLFQKRIYYGNIEEVPVITYAVSVGESDYEDFLKFPYIIEDIKKIRTISVRDDQSELVVEKITGVLPTKVCDPTFLIEKAAFSEEYRDEFIENNKYILVYFYNGSISRNTKEIIKEFARKQGLKIVSAALYNDWVDHHVTCSPLQFSYILKKAEYVITGTFHGNIFSIINNKKFVCIPLSKKVRDLVGRLGLNDRIIKEEELDCSVLEDKLVFSEINYEEVELKISEMKEKSLEYLKASIKEYDNTNM